MILISRKDAENKINEHWKEAREVCARVKAPCNALYNIERMRNYEIEHDLKTIFDQDFVINEWCPFNGIYCAYMEHCSEDNLESLRKDFASQRTEDGYKFGYMANGYMEKCIEAELKRRLETNNALR